MSTNKIKEYYRVKADIDLDAIHENVVNAKALLFSGYLVLWHTYFQSFYLLVPVF